MEQFWVVLDLLVALASVVSPGFAQEARTRRFRFALLRRSAEQAFTVRSESLLRYSISRGPATAGEIFRRPQLHGETKEGPPFAVEWTDENPYEGREISVEVCDRMGSACAMSSASSHTCCWRKPRFRACWSRRRYSRKDGKSISGLQTGDFTLLEDDVPQTLDLVRSDVVDSTVHILVDTSQSMSRRLDFVQRASERLLKHLAAHGSRDRGPFLKNCRQHHRSDR